ncbi:MAG: hypothetical protein DRP63_04960 [Planctomycetota bacterium]|nr:MAG: hypothetical protein DRP63_04960 [Planctomycetota bacterium]
MVKATDKKSIVCDFCFHPFSDPGKPPPICPQCRRVPLKSSFTITFLKFADTEQALYDSLERATSWVPIVVRAIRVGSDGDLFSSGADVSFTLQREYYMRDPNKESRAWVAHSATIEFLHRNWRAICGIGGSQTRYTSAAGSLVPLEFVSEIRNAVRQGNHKLAALIAGSTVLSLADDLSKILHRNFRVILSAVPRTPKQPIPVVNKANVISLLERYGVITLFAGGAYEDAREASVKSLCRMTNTKLKHFNLSALLLNSPYQADIAAILMLCHLKDGDFPNACTILKAMLEAPNPGPVSRHAVAYMASRIGDPFMAASLILSMSERTREKNRSIKKRKK